MQTLKTIQHGEWTTTIEYSQEFAKPYRVRTSSDRHHIEAGAFVDTYEQAQQAAADQMGETSRLTETNRTR